MSNMKKQYEQIKKQYPNHLLGFKLGEFYEFYYEDAKVVSGILDLVLTGRDDGSDERAPMVAFPIKCEMAYAGRLLNAGHKVAFLTQTDVEEINEGAR